MGKLEGAGGGVGGVLGYPEAFSARAQGFHSVCYAESLKGLKQGGDTNNGDCPFQNMSPSDVWGMDYEGERL